MRYLPALWIFAAMLLFNLSALALSGTPGVGQEAPVEQEKITIETQNGESHIFYVEIADEEEERQTGLMNRHRLALDTGMLFLFSDLEPRSFWMKNTFIPLDILFLDPDGTIHHIHHMAKPQDLTFVTSGRPAAAVLELNGGLSDRLGIKEGDRVLHRFFRNMLAD